MNNSPHQPKNYSAFISGIILVILLHILFILGLFLLFVNASVTSVPGGSTAWVHWLLFFMGIGNLWILQMIYVVPLLIIFRWKGQSEIFKGIFGASMITSLVNLSTCFAFPVVGGIAGLTQIPPIILVYIIGFFLFVTVATFSFFLIKTLLKDL
jgi:hypothetical protein